MAEYILKTELPITTCRVCPCAEHTPFGTACPIKRGSEKRYDTCPLVEIPTPHGRLGDLDKVANRMHRYAMACRKNGDPERAELWMYAEEEVRLQGTVVEASTEEK